MASFYGPTRLRWALTKSRNLVSIRLLQRLGVRKFINYAKHLGFDTSGYAPEYSLALGTQTITPLELAKGYAVLANGGYRVEPYIIARIEGLQGETLFEAKPPTVCRDCEFPSAAPPAHGEELSMEEIIAGKGARATDLPPAPRVMDERVNFIIDSILKDVITKGTGATRTGSGAQRYCRQNRHHQRPHGRLVLWLQPGRGHYGLGWL